MTYIQERSFIASLTSTTPGHEGILDSVEYSTEHGTRRNNEWLTLTSPWSVESQQRFWFGYFDGDKPGYQVRTIGLADGDAHYHTWDLSHGNNIGYYVNRKTPVLWRIWTQGEKLGVPDLGKYEEVTMAAVGSVPIGVRTRNPIENRYVQAGARHKLIMTLDVEHTAVPLFDSYSGLEEIRRRPL